MAEATEWHEVPMSARLDIDAEKAAYLLDITVLTSWIFAISAYYGG